MPKTIQELIQDSEAADSAVQSAQAAYDAARAAEVESNRKANESKSALASAKALQSQVKVDLLHALGGIPAPNTPLPAPSPRPAPVTPVPAPVSQNNLVLYILIVCIGLLAAHQFHLIPFKWNRPEPPPIPAPANNDPLRVSYIYDKNNVTQDIGAIRDNIEKIQNSISPLNAKYRNYDVNDQEVKDSLMPAVQKANNQLPILVIQDEKDGKLVGDIISSPKTYQDIINAVKNVRK